MTDHEANGNQPANDPLGATLQGLMQESSALLDALIQSEKWPLIEPELTGAMTAIEEGMIVSASAVCQKLQDQVSPEDLFNLHGLLVSRMAIERLAIIRENWPEDPLKIGLLVYLATATGAASQRLHDSGPVKRALNEWEPYVQRDLARLQKCSDGGIESGITRAEKAESRHAEIIAAAQKMIDARKSRAVVVNVLKKQALKGRGEAYSKRQIQRILEKAEKEGSLTFKS